MEIIPVVPLAVALVVPFIVAFVALRSVLLKPLVEYLDARDRAVVDARHEAERLDKDAADRMAGLEKRLQGARDDVAALRAAARQRVSERQSATLHEARARADVKVSEAVALINAERVKAAASIGTMSQALAADIASTVLGRQVN